MNFFRLIIFLFFLVTLNSVNSFGKEFIGVISAAIGQIQNQNNEKLTNGSKIYFGDTIIVKEKSNAQVLLLDETVLTLGEDSEVVMDEFIYDPVSKDGKIVSNIVSGTVKIITGEISKKDPDNLEIKMPTGTLGARGTEFVVLAGTNDSTVVLLGPGPNNSLGMIPGNIEVSDGENTIGIVTPGHQSIITN